MQIASDHLISITSVIYHRISPRGTVQVDGRCGPTDCGDHLLATLAQCECILSHAGTWNLAAEPIGGGITACVRPATMYVDLAFLHESNVCDGSSACCAGHQDGPRQDPAASVRH